MQYSSQATKAKRCVQTTEVIDVKQDEDALPVVHFRPKLALLVVPGRLSIIKIHDIQGVSFYEFSSGLYLIAH